MNECFNGVALYQGRTLVVPQRPQLLMWFS